MSIKPNFIGIGAPKCGTTWTSECLRYHPEIYVSDPKETEFFSTNFCLGLECYFKYFEKANGYKGVGEFSTNYMTHPEAAKRIYEVLEEVKIIAILRNPYDRFISHYMQYVREGLLPLADNLKITEKVFSKAISLFPILIRAGIYSCDLQKFLNRFDRKQVLIILKDELDSNPLRTISRIYGFIGVDSRFIPPIINRRVSPAYIPRFMFLEFIRLKSYLIAYHLQPQVISMIHKYRLNELYRKVNTNKKVAKITLTKDVTRFLTSYYTEDICALSSLLKVDLSEWYNVSVKSGQK